MLSRRSFVFSLTAAVHVLRPRQQGGHPDPRPGIDGRNVLTAEGLRGYGDDIIELFNHVREMPQIADGLRCYCRCTGQPGLRSLLSCYEGGGMAADCEICQAEGRLVYNRFKEGQTLEQIRRAVEARFAHG